MTIEALLELLEAEAGRMSKEGSAYGKMAGLNEPDLATLPPKDIPSERLCYAYSAGAYQLCAKGIRDIIKTARKQHPKNDNETPCHT